MQIHKKYLLLIIGLLCLWHLKTYSLEYKTTAQSPKMIKLLPQNAAISVDPHTKIIITYSVPVVNFSVYTVMLFYYYHQQIIHIKYKLINDHDQIFTIIPNHQLHRHTIYHIRISEINAAIDDAIIPDINSKFTTK
jgi:hypothetical protein